jgi:hypothetical protein
VSLKQHCNQPRTQDLLLAAILENRAGRPWVRGCIVISIKRKLLHAAFKLLSQIVHSYINVTLPSPHPPTLQSWFPGYFRKTLCNTREYHMVLNTTLYRGGRGGGGEHNVSPKYSTFFSSNKRFQLVPK